MKKTITKNYTIKRAIIIILALLCAACCFAACGTAEREGIKVVYELEGATYKNSGEAVEVRYNFKSGAAKNIKALEDLPAGAQSTIEKAGFRLEGWYKTKTVSGETVTYSDKWDFSTETVSEEGVTLYAHWVPITVYKYVICNSDNQEIGEYETDVAIPFGESFVQKELISAADNYEGYTPTGEFFEDAALTVGFKNDFTFSQSETDQVKKVYAKYLKGNFKVVKTAAELSALTVSDDGAYQGKAIYLLNDIDCGGDQVDFASLFTENSNALEDAPAECKIRFTGIIGAGEGKKISNLIVSTGGDYSETDHSGEEIGTVKASVLGDLNGVTVKNVIFDGVTVHVIADRVGAMEKVEFAPLCGKATNSVLENVSVNITAYKIRLLVNSPEIVTSEKGGKWNVAFISENSSIINCNATVAEMQEDGSIY